MNNAWSVAELELGSQVAQCACVMDFTPSLLKIKANCSESSGLGQQANTITPSSARGYCIYIITLIVGDFIYLFYDSVVFLFLNAATIRTIRQAITPPTKPPMTAICARLGDKRLGGKVGRSK